MSTDRAARGVKRHSISRADAFRVADWIRQNWPSIQQERPTYSHLIDRIKTATGIATVPANIQGIVADLGFTWHTPKRAVRADGRNDRVRILARCVAELFRRLDEPMPPEIGLIMRGMTIPTVGTEAGEDAHDDR